MRQTKQLQGALIGAGKISHFHLRAWQRIPQAEIVAIADVNLDNAQARAQEFGLDLKRTYATLADLLQHEKNLDFIDLVTPVDARVELVKLAAEHGLHINCQKPFARTLAEARELAGPDITLWGGIPQDMLVETYDEEQFLAAIKQCVQDARGDGRMILGVADRVPVQADISRLKALPGLVQQALMTL